MSTHHGLFSLLSKTWRSLVHVGLQDCEIRFVHSLVLHVLGRRTEANRMLLRAEQLLMEGWNAWPIQNYMLDGLKAMLGKYGGYLEGSLEMNVCQNYCHI